MPSSIKRKLSHEIFAPPSNIKRVRPGEEVYFTVKENIPTSPDSAEEVFRRLRELFGDVDTNEPRDSVSVYSRDSAIIDPLGQETLEYSNSTDDMFMASDPFRDSGFVEHCAPSLTPHISTSCSDKSISEVIDYYLNRSLEAETFESEPTLCPPPSTPFSTPIIPIPPVIIVHPPTPPKRNIVYTMYGSMSSAGSGGTRARPTQPFVSVPTYSRNSAARKSKDEENHLHPRAAKYERRKGKKHPLHQVSAPTRSDSAMTRIMMQNPESQLSHRAHVPEGIPQKSEPVSKMPNNASHSSTISPIPFAAPTSKHVDDLVFTLSVYLNQECPPTVSSSQAPIKPKSHRKSLSAKFLRSFRRDFRPEN